MLLPLDCKCLKNVRDQVVFIPVLYMKSVDAHVCWMNEWMSEWVSESLEFHGREPNFDSF